MFFFIFRKKTRNKKPNHRLSFFFHYLVCVACVGGSVGVEVDDAAGVAGLVDGAAGVAAAGAVAGVGFSV
jgi:hypothetical protein